MNENCNIIKDLLPLYNENLCSEETASFVSKHLEQCPDCMALTENAYQVELKAEPHIDGKKPFLKIKKKTRRIVILCAFLGLIISVIAAYNIVGQTRGYIKADRIFFGISWDNICGSVAGEAEYSFNDKAAGAYLEKFSENGISITEDGLKQTYDEIDDLFPVVFNYDDIVCYDWWDDLGDKPRKEEFYIYVPVKMGDKDLAMGLYGIRTGIGKYFFYKIDIVTPDIKLKHAIEFRCKTTASEISHKASGTVVYNHDDLASNYYSNITAAEGPADGLYIYHDDTPDSSYVDENGNKVYATDYYITIENGTMIYTTNCGDHLWPAKKEEYICLKKEGSDFIFMGAKEDFFTELEGIGLGGGFEIRLTDDGFILGNFEDRNRDDTYDMHFIKQK